MKPLSIVFEQTMKKLWMKENDNENDFSFFKVYGENCMKIITTAQIFLSYYKLSRFLK
jgi:hypothetical protein